MITEQRPNITNKADLMVLHCFDETKGRSIEWYHFTADDEAYFGISYKNGRDITMDDFNAGLKRMSDDAIFPKIPTDAQVTIAPKDLDGAAVHIKRSGLHRYDHTDEDKCEAKDQLLAEVLVMEKISKTPHPYVVRYHGCTVHRGRITALAMERLGKTLHHYAHCRGECDHSTTFEQIDKQAFLAGVESAVKFLHSLGLAHNDINPRNIMVRETSDGDGACTPVLIDFDSCAPFGTEALSLGTAGFMDMEDEDIFTSQKRHDDFALKRLAEWWDEEHGPENDPGMENFPNTD
jgi:serine/threonine protein kinase